MNDKYKIVKLSAMGIAGFIAGCILLFYADIWTLRTPDSIFHEIKYRPGIYVDTMLSHTILSLKDSITSRKEILTAYEKATNADSVKYKKKLSLKNDGDSASLVQLSTYNQYYDDVSEADSMSFTQLNRALHFQITPDTINKWSKDFDSIGYTWKSNSVHFSFKDSKIPFKIKDSAIFEIKQAPTDVAFITKYPGAGIWVILVLIFCSFCFIALSTAIYLKTKITDIFKGREVADMKGHSYYWICAFTIIMIFLMGIIWQVTFYDDNIVKNIFFMKNLSTSMFGVIILGSVCGGACLAGFIYTASMLSNLSSPLIKIRKEVAAQRVMVNTQRTVAHRSQAQDFDALEKQAPPPPTAEEIELAKKEAEQATQEVFFTKLAKIFQSYFLLAAIILSLMVVCTGALFSTVNSLDFIKLLADDWGFSPVRNDFIYLYGSLYTIILLLVYIPAKMRFSEVDIWSKPAPAGSSKWYDFLKNPFGQIKDVLVATSPLLVSLVQSLFDILFK